MCLLTSFFYNPQVLQPLHKREDLRTTSELGGYISCANVFKQQFSPRLGFVFWKTEFAQSHIMNQKAGMWLANSTNSQDYLSLINAVFQIQRSPEELYYSVSHFTGQSLFICFSSNGMTSVLTEKRLQVWGSIHNKENYFSFIFPS